MDRNQLLRIRPIIKKAEVNIQTSLIEQFQNETLRPIIKFQHDIWISWFNMHATKFKIDLNHLTSEKKFIAIQNLIGKEKDLKNQVIGMVCGYFTLAEFENYQFNATAINKRIVGMVIERIQSVIA